MDDNKSYKKQKEVLKGDEIFDMINKSNKVLQTNYQSLKRQTEDHYNSLSIPAVLIITETSFKQKTNRTFETEGLITRT